MFPFAGFLLIDFPESLSSNHYEGMEKELEKGGSKDCLNLLNQTLHLLTELHRKFAPAPDIPWTLLGLGDDVFYQKLTEITDKNSEIKSFPFDLKDIEQDLVQFGFKEGFDSKIEKIISHLTHPVFSFFSLIGFSHQLKKRNYFHGNFLPKLAGGIQAQPIWFIKKSWLDQCEESDFYLLLLHLPESYFFVEMFPLVVYDRQNLLSIDYIDRTQIGDREHVKNLLKASSQPNHKNTSSWNNQLSKVIDRLKTHHPIEMNSSPILFKQKLIDEVKKNQKKILLVEGHEVRVLQAITKIINYGYLGDGELSVIGHPGEIEKLATKNNLSVYGRIKIIEPQKHHSQYTPILFETMKRKNITWEEAETMVKNDLNLAGLMLKDGEFDGVVAGAHYSSADTLKAAIRMVGVEEKYSLVSSFFIMLLPHRVMLFSDCAVNPSPSVEQLAEIALQTIESARNLFFPSLKVSLISFSTMGSALTPEVEKVSRAVELAKKKIEEMGISQVIIEGPVQYDAATNPRVAAKKFPSSEIAGKSNILIFPNLETGNTVYKAVQQSHNPDECHCIGPIIQGLKKPFNDLSRGATVGDITQTILITARQ